MPNIVLFGDSLSDSGNLMHIVEEYLFKILFPQAVNGTITNGLTWIEDIAVRLKMRYFLGNYKTSTLSFLLANGPNKSHSDKVDKKVQNDVSDNDEKLKSCKNKCNHEFIVNYAIIMAKISSNNRYRSLSFQVDKFIEDYLAQRYPYSDCPNEPLDIVFFIGTNDLIDLIAPFIELYSSSDDLDIVAILKKYHKIFNQILDSYAEQWLRICKLFNLKNQTTHQALRRMFISNIPDITSSYYFIRMLHKSDIDGEDAAIATWIFQQLIILYNDSLKKRIKTFMLKECGIKIILMDVYAMTNFINDNKSCFGITSDNLHPIWQLKDDAVLSKIKLNPQFKNVSTHRGAALWDDFHPAKDYHLALSFFIESVLFK